MALNWAKSARIDAALVDHSDAEKLTLTKGHWPMTQFDCQITRRAMLGGLGVGVAAMATAPQAQAQLDDGYEAMLMKCIDPRFTTNSWNYMTTRGWQNNYSEFAFAGGPVGVVAPVFAAWHETFWENLEISVDLHWVKRVVGMTHRDCGAAAVAYGDRLKTDRDFETEMLSMALREFRAQVLQREPEIGVELGIMEFDGSVQYVD